MLRRSTQIFLFALAFILGIGLRSWVRVPLVAAYGLGWVGLGMIILGWNFDRGDRGNRGNMGDRVDRGERGRWRTAGVCVIVLALGIWRLDVAYQAPRWDDPSFFAGKDIVLSGVVARDPEVRLKTVKIVVEVEEVNGEEEVKDVRGKTLVIAPALVAFEVGDRVRMRCDLEKPEQIEDFDYPRYLAKDGIFSVCNFPDSIEREAGRRGVRWALARSKRDFIASLNRVVPEPESAFLAGILTGARGRIPPAILDDFKTAGISHLLAISGYNIVVIATGVLVALTLFIRRHAAFPVLVGFIVGFALLVGGSASVVRAAIMGLVLHACYVSDRLYRPGFVLTETAAMMLALNPRLLRDDLGFDLSFLATLGLISLGPAFKRKLSWLTDRWHIREGIAMTLGAQVMTLPLLVGSFDRVSLVSLPANALIVPFIPFTMALGFAAGISGVIPGLGQAVGVIAYAVGHVILGVAHALASIPAATVTLPEGAWMVVVGLYAVVGLGWWKRAWARRVLKEWRRKFRRESLLKTGEEIKAQGVEVAEVALDDGHPTYDSSLSMGEVDTTVTLEPASDHTLADKLPRYNALVTWLKLHKVILGMLVSSAILFAVFIPQYLNWKRFSVMIFDVGQGDAILVSAPQGKQLLIDGGPDATVLSKLGKAMPWWDRTIEYMALSHPHADHVTGLVEVLHRYKVQKVFITGVVHTTNEYLAFLSALNEQNVKIEVPKAGDEFQIGGATVKVLAPLESYEGKRVSELNDTSIVLRLEYQDATFLFTGDAGVEVEPGLIERWGMELDSDVLKVGHQGSSDATSQEFIDAVTPRYAVISVGANNMYGHPSLRVIRRLERAGATVLRTDRQGDARFEIGDSGIKAR